MKKSMELEIEINKLRAQALADDASLETIAEIRSAVDLATQKRTVALEAEGAEQEAAEAKVAEQRESEGHQETETAEQREWLVIAEKAEIRDFLQAFSRHEQIDRVPGAAAEFRAALYGQDIGSEWMPLPMLWTPEERAASVLTAIQENQGDIAGRTFGRGDAAFLGVAQPTVPIGIASYSHLATGVAPAVEDEGDNVNQTAATVTTTTLNPFRVGAQYLIGIETTGRVLGIESVLRNDLRAAVSNANDNLIIAGNAADPDIDGMIDALGTQPANPAAVVTGLTAHAAFWDGVDGLLSYRGDGSRILTNVATIKKLAELQIGTNGPLLVDRYGDGVLRASARMPAGTNAFHNYVLFKPQATGYAVNPIWNGIAFIRDVYTNARAGQLAITAHMLVNFKLVRTGGHVLGKFDIV